MSDHDIDALIAHAHSNGWQVTVDHVESPWVRQVRLLKDGLNIDLHTRHDRKMDSGWRVDYAAVSNGHLTITINTDHLNTLRKFIVRGNRTFRL